MSDSRLKILILGGYGTFGGRLVRLLADEPRLTLVVAGRSLQTARRFCKSLAATTTLVPLAFDRDADVASQLAPIAPDVIVDASGPFQAYGADPYRVVEAALSLGCSYLDLADGAGFVRGITQFDEAARARGRFVLSGVSTLPALSGAAVRKLAEGLSTVDAVALGIAPSPHARLGLSVIRAIASYAGRPLPLLREGRHATGHGLLDARRYVIAPPGHLPLRSIRFTLVDAPDLQTLPMRWPGLQSVWTGAGPTPEILHRGLSVLAWLVRLRLLPSLLPLAPLFHRAHDALAWGEHRSGMFVDLAGRHADGTPARRAWHVVAEGGDGPLIPSMAAAILVRRTLAGTAPAAGARPADAELELAGFEAMFARFRIVSGTRDDSAAPDAPLYQRALGSAWHDLPEPIRRLHETGAGMVAEGRARVERGRNPLSRLVGMLFGFPRAGADVAVRVEISAHGGVERWHRSFAGRRLASTQQMGAGRFGRLIVERFGPFRFGLALVLEDRRLRLIPRRWTALGLPMPAALLPHGKSWEAVEEGRFRFHVEIRLPLAGLIVRYQGALQRLD